MRLKLDISSEAGKPTLNEFSYVSIFTDFQAGTRLVVANRIVDLRMSQQEGDDVGPRKTTSDVEWSLT